MSEAIRFYWSTGEAKLPLQAVPEEDRNPLRLRRSVVQAHAPAVLAQLEAGRFVAVVWSSAGNLLMILCHPNLAKGGSDIFLVNPASLPRLTVKVGSWEEALGLAGLFLRAFGSEAATPEECAAARRDLAAWLAARAQPQMAAVTRHYSAFPFGVRSDALEVINVWRKVLVKGKKEQVDQFLEEAQKRFASLGWSRDTRREDQWNAAEHQVNRFYCWVGGREATPQLMLCLNRVTDRRVRGSTYEVLDQRSGFGDVARVIQQVLREVLEPVAAAAGLTVAYPHLGPISRIGEKTAEAMSALAEAGDGEWPLPQATEPVWRRFVRTAYREQVAIKPEELIAWFNASGWDADPANELANRFYSDIALLAEYEEAGRQPA